MAADRKKIMDFWLATAGKFCRKHVLCLMTVGRKIIVVWFDWSWRILGENMCWPSYSPIFIQHVVFIYSQKSICQSIGYWGVCLVQGKAISKKKKNGWEFSWALNHAVSGNIEGLGEGGWFLVHVWRSLHLFLVNVGSSKFCCFFFFSFVVSLDKTRPYSDEQPLNMGV